MELINKLKQIYTLDNRNWLNKSGMSKGIHHDRQHLGIILPAGEPIRIRQVNPEFTGELLLRLLNDDQNTQVKTKFSTEWQEISVDAVSVPFVNTPYSTIIPQIEFQYNDTCKLLPFLRPGNDENRFLQEWDDQNAEYAVLESDKVIILVPEVSKEKVREIISSSGISTLFSFYENVFNYYNYFAGLSFEYHNETDKNTLNRYFLKADRHGAGGAYYSQDWAAQTSSSVNSYWLNSKNNNWGALHEIAHGYQLDSIDDDLMSTREVWNNIYGATYQDLMLGDDKFKEGWLYNYGKQKEVESKIAEYLSTGTKVTSWENRQKLYFFMLMIEKSGSEGFTFYNRWYRQLKNSTDAYYKMPYMLDMLSESFAVTGNKTDMTLFINLCGGPLSREQALKNAFKHARVVYPLNQFLQGEALSLLREKLCLNSEFSLVDTTQLKKSGLNGDVVIHLHIDDFSQIYGENIIVLDGSRYVLTQPVTDSIIHLKELPVGVYTLRIPTGRDKKYSTVTQYLIVREGVSELNVLLTHKLKSSIVSQLFTFYGLGDKEVATVNVDQERNTLIVDVFNEKPQYLIPDKYAQIIVSDKDGNELLNKLITGVDTPLSHDEIDLELCHTIELYHKEPGRLRVKPIAESLLDKKSKTNILEFTPYGLKNEVLGHDPQLWLVSHIDSVANELRNNPVVINSEYSEIKDDIYLAIDLYSSPTRDELLLNYKDCLSLNNDKPDEYLGNRFEISMAGINDRKFLSVDLDLNSKKMTISLASGTAHSGFNRTYASFRYINEYGDEILNLDIIGSVKQSAKTWEFPISGYGKEKIYLQHEEPKNRLIVNNKMQSIRLSDRNKVQSYEVTPFGLVSII
ncbi:enhancing factor [Salmonella enterica subsp. enterica]|nr:enhancing factor [Salmonella enterica subsp. enterica serovar Newport]